MAGRTQHIQHPTPSSHMEPRVSRLESVVEGLDEDIKSLSASFDRMAKSTSDALQRQYDVIDRQSTQVNAAISALQTTIAGSGKANWPLVIAACGLVLAISGTVGGLAMQPWKDRHLLLEDRVMRHEQLHGAQYVETVRELAKHEAAIASQGVTNDLHYEMNMERIQHLRETADASRRPQTGPALPGPAGPGTSPATPAAP